MSYHHGNLRDALLIRAENVIEEKGLDALKLSTLAKDLGVSHNAPSRHFKDRNNLIAALASRALEGLKAYVANADGIDSKDPMTRLNTVIKYYVLYAAKHPAHFVVLTHPELPLIAGDAFTKSHRDYTAFVTTCTRAAQRAGWHKNEDTDKVTLLNLSMALGLAVMGQYGVKSGLTSVSDSISLLEDVVDLHIPARTLELNNGIT